MALLCVAVLCIAASLLIWAIFLPFCYVLAPATAVAGLIDKEPRVSSAVSCSLVPARAPPVIS